MKQNLGFRAWYYFRMGWGTYFAFIFAAINTLTVTFYLAIEKYPTLEFIFPTFIHYVGIVSCIGVPMLILIGYVHFKRTAARKAEVDISVETNPYQLRNLVNSELIINLNVRIAKIILDSEQGKKIDEDDLKKLQEVLNTTEGFLSKRTVAKERDLEFFRKINQSGKL